MFKFLIYIIAYKIFKFYLKNNARNESNAESRSIKSQAYINRLEE